MSDKDIKFSFTLPNSVVRYGNGFPAMLSESMAARLLNATEAGFFRTPTARVEPFSIEKLHEKLAEMEQTLKDQPIKHINVRVSDYVPQGEPLLLCHPDDFKKFKKAE